MPEVELKLKEKRVRARKIREDIEKKINPLEDMVMKLDEKGRQEGLELLQRLREILQGSGVTDEIERACEEVGLDEKEIKTVLDCIGDHLREVVGGSAFEVLWEIIGRCYGSDDCDLCHRVLERVEAKEFHKEKVSRQNP